MDFTQEMSSAFFPMRPMDAHKYSVGTITVVGGSVRFMNAPVIAAIGARSAGAGLVQLVVPDASRIAAGVHVPEATFLKLTPICVPPKADVTVIGMGLGVSQTSEMLVSRLLSGTKGRFVLDADALTIMANWYAKAPDVPVVDGRHMVMTPHEGEAAKLLACKIEDIRADRVAAVKSLARRYHCVAVLKGAGTLVATRDSDEVFKCEAGNPYMALGGMGDLLAGVITARWAYLSHMYPGEDDVELARRAAVSGVWLHAVAGDALVKGDIPEEPSVVNVAREIARNRIRLEMSSK